MRQKWQVFLKDQSGATAIEYGLLVGLVGLAIIVSMGGLKDKLVALLEVISTALQNA
ncbi:Flp family type IVb pilin [Cohaesibacter celericrescens]|uniref:Flp family type IVb pilin n=1 Tax=Cohaesibacter celericrescens TaxID=2067669 RepID=UPI00356279ED